MPRRVQHGLRQRLALNARHRREHLGWTQELAAERVGCSVQSLQRLERAAAAFTLDFIGQVAAAYKVDVLDLLEPAGPWHAPQPGRPRHDSIAAQEPREAYRAQRGAKRRPRQPGEQ